MSKIKDIFYLFFPIRCVGCHRILPVSQEVLCLHCAQKLHFTHWDSFQENELYEQIAEEVDIKSAMSLLYFTSESLVQKILHANKYKNQPQIGRFLAHYAIKEYGEMYKNKISLVTCVPSHQRTLRERGYNQVAYFTEELSKNLDLKFNPYLFERIAQKSSQTGLNKTERMQSLEKSFKINEQSLHGVKELLIIDDVATTGATLIHCVQALRHHSNILVHVLTIAKAR